MGVTAEMSLHRVLAERVRYFKESEEGSTTMCRAFEEMQEKARTEERHSFAQKMLEAGRFALEEIAKFSNLPLEEVKRLAAEMQQ